MRTHQSPSEDDSVECPPNLTFTPAFNSETSHTHTKHPRMSPQELGGNAKPQSEMKGSICLRKLDTNKPGVNHQGQNYFSGLVTGLPTQQCPSPALLQSLFVRVAGLLTDRSDAQG